MAHSSRTWKGARTPSALKRVRQSERKHAVNQARRSETKTLVKKALTVAGEGQAEQTATALVEAVSALDKAAKVGTIHPNAAARRKSRLMRKVNAALGGTVVGAAAKPTRVTGKAAAQKAARARVAASKAAKAKGEQTAAGKARAALTRSTRGDHGKPAAEATTPKPEAKASATKTATKGAGKTAATKAAKAAPKATSKAKSTTASKPAAKRATKA